MTRMFARIASNIAKLPSLRLPLPAPLIAPNSKAVGAPTLRRKTKKEGDDDVYDTRSRRGRHIQEGNRWFLRRRRAAACGNGRET